MASDRVSELQVSKEEQLLCLWLKAMAKIGIPVKPRQLLDAVEDILKKYRRPSPFTEGRPERNATHIFEKPETLSIARSLVTERAIRRWHNDLKQHIIQQTGNTDMLKDPSRMINGDESGFQTNPVTSLVTWPKGSK
ncbi:hypothetical protein PR048_011292 [Dryococelus australis]|uniref:Uncharacterized protein n=1 Tax=Dryococelus australis TaxID=614101 RepID=A0ABQ9HLX2_9NEOP|nr:hypothetical protein PR048_011292 [Dryococelus australis]